MKGSRWESSLHKIKSIHEPFLIKARKTVLSNVKPFFMQMFRLIPREARAEGPSVARLINLSGQAGPSGAKPREFERKIYLYIYIYIC